MTDKQQTNYSVDVRVQAGSDVQPKYTQPREIIRSENDPVLLELTGTIVTKVSWPGIDRQSNEANMFRDSAGRFGTIPHVCSYEGVGEHREVISNILFFPQENEIPRYYWPIFTNTPPESLDIRSLRFTVFGVEGKSLLEAKSPRQLSRAWVHSLLGTFVIAHLCILQLICLPRRVAIDVPVWALAQGSQPRERPHDGRTCEEENVRDTPGVPGAPVLIVGPEERGGDREVVYES